MKTPNYYNTQEGGFTPIPHPCYPVENAPFGIKLVAHRQIENPNNWSVTEVSSGFGVIFCRPSRKSAIEAAIAYITRNGEEKTLYAIAGAISRNGEANPC